MADMKGLPAEIANRSGLIDAYGFFRRKLTKSQVAILMYHRVDDEWDRWFLKPLRVRSFEKQTQYLCQNYDVLRLSELLHYANHRKSLPEKAVVITFDDGYKDNYLYAYPIRKYDIPATVFLATGCIGSDKAIWRGQVRHISTIEPDALEASSMTLPRGEGEVAFSVREARKQVSHDNRTYYLERLRNISGGQIPAQLSRRYMLSWEEVMEMHSGGISFGAHTVSHRILTRMPFPQAKDEIVRSKKAIEEKVGHAVTAFSYPYGDYNLQVTRCVKESGFACAVTTIPRLTTCKHSPYELPRIEPGEDFNKFKLQLSGMWGDLHAMLIKK